MDRIPDHAIATAIAENILHLDMTPRTEVQSASAGNDYADVADASHFTRDCTVTFWDDTGEPENAIARVETGATPHRIHFELPLTSDHLAGAVVSTNLLDYVPEQFSTALAKGDPLIFVAPIQTRIGFRAMRLATGPVRIHIQFNVADEQNDTPKLHPNLWTKQQQVRCGDALMDIIQALLRNPHLKTPTKPPIAQRIGDQNAEHVAEIAYDRFVTRDDVPVFAAATHIIVTPRPMTT